MLEFFRLPDSQIDNDRPSPPGKIETPLGQVKFQSWIPGCMREESPLSIENVDRLVGLPRGFAMSWETNQLRLEGILCRPPLRYVNIASCWAMIWRAEIRARIDEACFRARIESTDVESFSSESSGEHFLGLELENQEWILAIGTVDWRDYLETNDYQWGHTHLSATRFGESIQLERSKHSMTMRTPELTPGDRIQHLFAIAWQPNTKDENLRQSAEIQTDWRLGHLLEDLGIGDPPSTLLGVLHESDEFLSRGEFRNAESVLLRNAGMALVWEFEEEPERWRGFFARRLSRLYKKWHIAEPGSGFDAKAAEWESKSNTSDDR